MRPLLFALALAALLAGCTSHKTTVDSNGTTVTTSGDNQTVTVQGKEGTAVAGKNAVDVAKLGLPVYPGANPSENVGYAGSNAQGSGAMVVLTTKDGFDKVYGWYKGQMPAGSEKMKTSSDTGSMAVFQIGKESDKTQKVVTITSGTDSTSIMLTSGTKNN
jgi:hypothetical protein